MSRGRTYNIVRRRRVTTLVESLEWEENDCRRLAASCVYLVNVSSVADDTSYRRFIFRVRSRVSRFSPGLSSRPADYFRLRLRQSLYNVFVRHRCTFPDRSVIFVFLELFCYKKYFITKILYFSVSHTQQQYCGAFKWVFFYFTVRWSFVFGFIILLIRHIGCKAL